jgi:hypothetical protein
MTTATECSPSIGPMLPGFETCETLERTTSKRWTSSVAVSRARTLALPDNGQGSKESAPRSGASLPASLASLDQDGCWRRTCQGYSQVMMDGSLETYSGTWPRAGMMRSGTVYPLPPLAPRTDEIGCSLLPTPTDASKGGGSSRSGARRDETPTLQGMARKGLWPTIRATDGERGGRGDLLQAIRMNPSPTGRYRLVPTPMSQNWRSGKTRANYGNSRPLQEIVSGLLNPTWVEWLMGLPLGWTNLDVSETP